MRHNVPLLYDGEPVELNGPQEEAATHYAEVEAQDGNQQLANAETRVIFQKNFFHDFQEVRVVAVPPPHPH